MVELVPKRKLKGEASSRTNYAKQSLSLMTVLKIHFVHGDI